MQFLVIFTRRPEFTEEDFIAHGEVEIEAASHLYASGFMRNLWKTHKTGAAMMVEASSEAEVVKQLATLPYIQKNMLETQILPLNPHVRFFGPRAKK